MKKTTNYGKTIAFSEVFRKSEYLPSYGDKFPTNKIVLNDLSPKDSESTQFCIGNSFSHKKCIFERMHIQRGIIIGQTSRKEGVHHPSQISREDGSIESGFLNIKKVFSLWVVSTDMNQTVLVDKSSQCEIL